jgi:hypothetical protein
MFFLPIIMSVSALIAMLLPTMNHVGPTLSHVVTSLQTSITQSLKVDPDPIGNIIMLLHPAPVSCCS